MLHKKFTSVLIGFFSIFLICLLFNYKNLSLADIYANAEYSNLTLDNIIKNDVDNEMIFDYAEIAGGGYVLLTYSDKSYTKIYSAGGELEKSILNDNVGLSSLAVDKSGNFYAGGSIEEKIEGVSNYFAYLVKYKNNQMEWETKIGIDGRNNFSKLFVTDNSIIAVGYKNHQRGYVGFSYGHGFIAEYDFSGNLLKNNEFGSGSSDTRFTDVKKVNDGFVVSGYSKSQEAEWYDKSKPHPNYAGIVLKLDNDFNLKWSKLIGVTTEYINSLEILKDGSIVLAGNTNSGTFYTYSMQYADTSGTRGFIAKLNPLGEIKDIQLYGSNIESLAAAEDGGFFAIIKSSVSNGLWQNKGSYDNIILKFNKSFELFYTKNIGGEKEDDINYIKKSHDNFYTVFGFSKSTTPLWEVSNNLYAGIILTLTDLNINISFSESPVLNVFNPYYFENVIIKSARYFIVEYADFQDYEQNFNIIYGYAKSEKKGELTKKDDGLITEYTLGINKNCTIWYEVVYVLNGTELSFVKQYKNDNFLTPVKITVSCLNTDGTVLDTIIIQDLVYFIYDLDDRHIFTITDGVKYDTASIISITIPAKNINGYKSDENIKVAINNENITAQIIYTPLNPDTPKLPLYAILLIIFSSIILILISTILIIVLVKNRKALTKL